MATLGEKLRAAREQRGFTLREVADQTRISARYLEAIEGDDYRGLPGGVFNKGFVRSYARYVGIDEKDALNDYAELMTNGSELSEPPPVARRSPVLIGDEPRSPLLTILLALIVLGVLSGGIIYGVQWYQQQTAQSANATPTPTPGNTANTTPQPTATPAAPVSTTNGLQVQVKATSDKVALTVVADGKQQAYTLEPNEAKEFTAQQSLNVRYSKYLASTLQMTINGRPAQVQTTPPTPRAQGIEMQITRENVNTFFGGTLSPNASATPTGGQ